MLERNYVKEVGTCSSTFLVAHQMANSHKTDQNVNKFGMAGEPSKRKIEFESGLNLAVVEEGGKKQ